MRHNDLMQYLNKARITKAINILNDCKEKGLEDFETGRIAVSPEKVQTAVEMFEQNRDGEYFSNIIDYPQFTTREAMVILSYVGRVTYDEE